MRRELVRKTYYNYGRNYLLVQLNPENSRLGISIKQHETFSNQKGELSVIFRYQYDDVSQFEKGLQVQYETIRYKEFRGNHYHYPEYAGEEFYLLEGYAVLIVSNLDMSIIEVYLLKRNVTYQITYKIFRTI